MNLKKNGNFAWIYIRDLENIVYIMHNKSYFRNIHIFADISETQITRKYVQREHFSNHSMYIHQLFYDIFKGSDDRTNSVCNQQEFIFQHIFHCIKTR